MSTLLIQDGDCWMEQKVQCAIARLPVNLH